MIADPDQYERVLRFRLARAEFERVAKDARLAEIRGGYDARHNGTTRLETRRALRDVAGDELHAALEAACE